MIYNEKYACLILLIIKNLYCRTECFCGNETPEWGLKLPDTFCDTQCPGNQSQICGGHYTINVFKTGVTSELLVCYYF